MRNSPGVFIFLGFLVFDTLMEDYKRILHSQQGTAEAIKRILRFLWMVNWRESLS